MMNSESSNLNSMMGTQFPSERSILKKGKELIQGMTSVFHAGCYNYSVDESVILICSQSDCIRLVDFGAQEFALTYSYIVA